jgi:predicted PurR-regulated permease PerM
VLALIVGLLIPPFIDQTNEFVEDVPGIVNDLEGYYADVTGQDPGEVGERVEEFVQDWTDEPERFIGPITSIGFDVAGSWPRSW